LLLVNCVYTIFAATNKEQPTNK